MGKINILTANVFNRIAAGEVIEHPYSIVKELTENAIDAGASEVEIRIERGGKDYISVRDNGEGIDYADLKSLYLPHATSKLCTAEDLENINTFGFRGEAVASIASVSRMSYTSRKEGENAYRIECDGGEIGEAKQVAETEKGTLAEVRDLFFNTKPRLGFFKSDRAEEGEITNCVQRFILSNPHISFRLYVDNKLTLNSYGGGEEEVLASVYGASVLSNTFHIHGVKNGIEVRGFISDRNFFKSNRSYQSIFLNGRYIVNSTIAAALTNAYASYTMKRQYPFYVLHIRIPNEVVDVNVHPTKSDVRFADNQVVYSAIYGIVSSVLDGSVKGTQYLVNAPMPTEMPKAEEIFSSDTEPYAPVSTPSPSIETERETPVFSPTTEQSEKKYSFEEIREEIRRANLEEWRKKRDEATPKKAKIDFKAEYNDLCQEENSMRISTQEEPDIFAENKRLLAEMESKKEQTRIDVDRCEYKGSLFNTFLLYEFGDNVYVIDQHAAHERLIFNRLREKMENRTIVKQNMLVPYRIRLTPSEDAFLFDCLPSLREMGFDIEDDVDGFVISAVPMDLQGISLDKFFELFLQDLDSFGKIKLESVLKDKLATMACKAAIKGGMSLTKEEVMQLISDMNGDITLKCPHGRPAVVVLSKYELEKMFKRIV